MARRLGVTLDETIADWRASPSWACGSCWTCRARTNGARPGPTRTLRRSSGRSWRVDRPSRPPPCPSLQRNPPTPVLAVPAAAAPTVISMAVPTAPAAATPAETGMAENGVATPPQAPVEAPAVPAATADTPAASPASSKTPALASGNVSQDVATKDDDTAFRIRLRPPLLKNIDLRDLSPEMQEVLRTKPRGITLLAASS